LRDDAQCRRREKLCSVAGLAKNSRRLRKTDKNNATTHRVYARRNTRLPGDIRMGQATIGGTVVEPTSLLRPNIMAVLLSYDPFFHTRSGYRSAVRVLPQQHAKNPARGSGRADALLDPAKFIAGSGHSQICLRGEEEGDRSPRTLYLVTCSHSVRGSSLMGAAQEPIACARGD